MKIKKYSWKICEFFRKIKWFFQRGRHGFADCDLWNFDLYLAKLFKEALNKFADTTIGWPDDDYETFEDWIRTLKDIAELTDQFDVDSLIDWDKPNSIEEFKRASEESDIAIEIFFDWMKKNFKNLWD